MDAGTVRIAVAPAGGRSWIDASEVEAKIPQLHFLRFYDAAAPGDPNTLEPSIWGIPSLLNAAVPSSALQQLDAAYIARAETALMSVPHEWRLEEDDPDGSRRKAVRNLLTVITEPDGIAQAIATKVLHKKRPLLIPIVDSVIAGFYDVDRPTDLIFDPFRDDLLRNRAILAHLASVVTAAAGLEVSSLRALELSIWLTSAQAGDAYRVELHRD